MKFSIVTTTFNRSAYLAQTIESVLSQKGDFEIEYLLIDGASTDDTLAIVKKYEEQIANDTYPILCKKIEMRVISEKDGGICDAYGKGFALATGDVMSGLGSDDMLLPGALESLRHIFNAHPEIAWVRGRHALMNASGTIFDVPPIRGYYRPWLSRGIYGRNAYWIAFEASFWRKSLWEKAGNMPRDVKQVCDYLLWAKFAKFTTLYSADAVLVAFRKHPLQDHQRAVDSYRQELLAHFPATRGDKFISLFFRITNAFPKMLSSIVPYLYVLCFGNHHFKFIRYDKNGNSRLVVSPFFE